MLRSSGVVGLELQKILVGRAPVPQRRCARVLGQLGGFLEPLRVEAGHHVRGKPAGADQQVYSHAPPRACCPMEARDPAERTPSSRGEASTPCSTSRPLSTTTSKSTNQHPNPVISTADPDRIMEKVSRGYQALASDH